MKTAKFRNVAAAVMAVTVALAAVNREAWINKVGDCAQDPAALRSTISALPAEDQVAFIAAVNAAISSMPGSDEVKSARFLAANRAAVAGASSTNRVAVLAEVFATVPPEYLTDINEKFAAELFNRNGDSSKTYSDEAYAAIAKNAMTEISQRCSTAENGDVRAAFAALMFIRASGGSPADLPATLAATLPGSRETAQNEWFPAALGENQTATYDPMLGAAQAGEEPNHEIVAELVSLQGTEALLAELASIGGENESAFDAAGLSPFNTLGMDDGSVTGDPADLDLNRIPRGFLVSPTMPDGVTPNPFYNPKRGKGSVVYGMPGKYWGQQ